MTSPKPEEFLEDILVSARLAREYVAGTSYDEFSNDTRQQDAVVHRLEIIGEAAGKLPEAVVNAVPAIPWAKMKGMRNLMVHQYWDISLKRVRAVVQDDLPAVIAAIEAYQPRHPGQ